MESGHSLPYTSSLCGACYEVCPVGDQHPEVLAHLRERVAEGDGRRSAERTAMGLLARVFATGGSMRPRSGWAGSRSAHSFAAARSAGFRGPSAAGRRRVISIRSLRRASVTGGDGASSPASVFA
jgi:L-lactate utilization protein LutB